jgi:Uma2 family endonuclease
MAVHLSRVARGHAVATRTKLTYEDYEAFPDDGNRYEIIDGEVFVTAAPSAPHQRAVTRLARFLDEHVEEHNLGEIYPSPFAVVLSPSDVFEPDVVYISRARSTMIDDRGVMRGAPDLCIEVASESTRKRDRTVKFERYAHFQIPEFWIVDTDAQTVAVFVLERDSYTPFMIAQGDDPIPSRVLPDLELRASALFTPRW